MTQRFEKKASTSSAAEYRASNANIQRQDFDTAAPISSDKTTTVTRGGVEYYTGVFSKCFNHNSFLEVRKDDVDRLITALDNADSDEVANVNLDPNSVRKLVSPQSALSFNFIGQDPFGLSMPAAPDLTSATLAAEMIEVYGMGLLRDVSFRDLQNGTTAQESIVSDVISDTIATGSAYLGPRGASGEVDRGTLFRGLTDGDKLGPYVSQFLLHDVSHGSLSYEQIIDIENDVISSLTQAGVEAIQNGEVNPPPNFSGTMKRINTIRAIASYVHNDPLSIAYFNAAMILLKNKAPQNPGLPNSPTEANFATFGGADLLAHIWNVGNVGLRVAWRQKWINHLRLRPEVAAVRVDKTIGGEDYGISNLLINSSTVANVLAANTAADADPATNTYFLPLVYPEGSPAHPAYPAGHAVVAGAACTIIKAFFDGTALMSSLNGGTFPIIESVTGDETMSELISAAITDPAITFNMSINGELNKLASNIATARNMAGVHYRSDGDEGVILGEKVAISYLKGLAGSYNEGGFTGFRLTKLDGTQITIT